MADKKNDAEEILDLVDQINDRQVETGRDTIITSVGD
jgi:hypothetical protein